MDGGFQTHRVTGEEISILNSKNANCVLQLFLNPRSLYAIRKAWKDTRPDDRRPVDRTAGGRNAGDFRGVLVCDHSIGRIIQSNDQRYCSDSLVRRL